MNEIRGSKLTAIRISASSENELVEQKPFSRIESLCLSTVLEECLQRLDILKHIMSKDALEAEANKPEFAVGNCHYRAHASYKKLESHPLVTKKLEERATYLDSNAKLQNDRNYIENIIENTQKELLKEGTYNSLIEAIIQEKEKSKMLTETISRETEINKTIEILNEEISKIEKEMKEKLQEEQQKISEETDKLRKTKARIAVEQVYMTKKMKVSLDQCRKRCSMNKEMKDNEFLELTQNFEIEDDVHFELKRFINAAIQTLLEKREQWMYKYTTDITEKDKELVDLVAAKKEATQEVEKLLSLQEECKKVIDDDINRKKMEREQHRQEIRRYWAAVKIQRWWQKIYVSKKIKKKKGKKKGKKKKPKS